MTDPTTTPRQLCTFSVGRLLFGVDVLDVQEVIRGQDMTGVPLAPPAISGLINLRGQIVTAVDLRTLLGLATDDAGDGTPLNVVVRTDDGAVSLLVDEIGDVQEVDEARLEQVPATVEPRTADLVSGIVKLDHELLLVLDSSRILDLAGAAAA